MHCMYIYVCIELIFIGESAKLIRFTVIQISLIVDRAHKSYKF